METAKNDQINVYNSSVVITTAIFVIALICVIFAVIITVLEVSRPIGRMSKELKEIVDGIKNNNGNLIMKQIKDSTNSLNSIIQYGR